MVEGLHAVLRCSGGDGVADRGGLFFVQDVIADERRRDEHFDSRNAGAALGGLHKPLRHNCFQQSGELDPDRFLLERRECRKDSRQCFLSVERVQGGQNEMARFGGDEGGLDSFEVTHFADEDHIRVLTQTSAKSFGKRSCIDIDLALGDKRFSVLVKEFDRVFDSDDVTIACGVDGINDRRKRGRFARTGRAGDQNKAAVFFGNGLQDRRQAEFRECFDRIRNYAGYDADRVSLLEDIDAKTPNPETP